MESEIIDITEAYLQKTDYKLIELSIKGEKKNRIVEVFLDSEGPISLDDLSAISRDLNQIISENEVNSFISKLVVSSPGVDKPYKFDWQLKKHIGRILEITPNEGETFEAKLEDIDGKGILTITKQAKNKKKGSKTSPEDSNGQIKIKFTDIKESKVIIKF